MSTQVVSSNWSVWKFWFARMIATIVGMATMILGVPFQIILEAAMGGVKAPPWTVTETILIMVLKGAQGGMMGLGMGLGQWLVFRKYLMNAHGWILATGLAMFLQGAFRWSLPYDMPAHQILVAVTISSGILTGVCQWFVLRGHVPRAESWIAICIVGSMPSLLLMFEPNLGQFLGMVFPAISFLAPFAIAGAGMIWLLRQSHQ